MTKFILAVTGHSKNIVGLTSLSALLMAALFVAGTPEAMAADGWAYQIISETKSAESQIARGNVRLASLGATDSDVVDRPSRIKTKAASIDAEDRPQKRTRVASLTSSRSDAGSEKPEKRQRSLAGGSVNWIASSGCLTGTLRRIVSSLASDFGPVTVNSTCRSRSRNASVGGAPKSYHLQGEAVDFRIHSNASAAYAALRNNGDVGGLKHYGGGLFHIDTGPRRSW